MTFRYEEAVPWGRSFDEYRRMFNLTDEELNSRIIGCADGPASFNAHMARRGYQMVSCDPLYQFTTTQIEARIEATYQNVIGQTCANQAHFVWNVIQSIDELGAVRLSAMREFLADFAHGKKQGRYIAAELPALPFATASFDLALCAHFLFFYSDNLALAFHEQAIATLCRIAKEVRIFPLLTYNAVRSPFIEEIIPHLEKSGRRVSIESVPYEFQRGGNQMLRIFPAAH